MDQPRETLIRHTFNRRPLGSGAPFVCSATASQSNGFWKLKKKIEGPSGRVITDDRGRSIWQTPMDSAQLKALSEQLSLECQDAPGQPVREKRRTLDDMRKLSEQIKSSKVWYRVPRSLRGGSSS